MFSNKNKEKEQKKVVKTTETRYVSQTSQTSVQTTVIRNRAVSYSGASISPSTSFPNLGNNNFLTPPIQKYGSNVGSTVSLGNPNLDARPVNINYQSPYRNSPVYSSYQASRPSSATPMQIPKPSYQIKPSTISAATGAAYRSALPATIQPLPTPKKEIIVKKTGRRYDSNSKVPTYQTNSKNRGEVLIINNIMFKDKGYRHGAEVDDKNLKTLFTQMGFKVTIKRDLTKSKMEEKVTNFSKNSSLSSADIAIVVVMSHGTKNPTLGGTEVFGLDERGVLVEDLIKNFTPVDCKRMANKPKIFIFQCCRGDNEQFIQSDATGVPPKVAAVTDALIAYSTLPGFVSHRDPEFGTWYISTLCNVFSQHAHEYPVEDLLKMVDVELSRLAKNVRQSTHYENRGFKRCFLHP